MSRPTFSIILPIYNHGSLIQNAIRSILWQSRQDFEVFIVGDGATAEGLDAARRTMSADPRFTIIENSKGPGHGELYRDEAIRQANGSIICYLGDDDFWLPNHLQVMESALKNSDLAYSVCFRIVQDGYFILGGRTLDQTLDNDEYRKECLENKNLAAIAQFSATAHRLQAYMELEEGWTPRLSNVISYASMWVKFIEANGVKIHPVSKVTSVILPSNLRRGFKGNRSSRLNYRYKETQTWMKLLGYRLLSDALDYRCKSCDVTSRVKIGLRHVTANYRSKRNHGMIAVDGHIAEIANTFTRDHLTWLNRFNLYMILARLKYLKLLPKKKTQ